MTATGPAPRHRAAAIIGLVAVITATAIALSVDVPRTGYGIKSDEATYVAATLSAAFDGNLSYERRDLERFAGLYHSGPEGIFLKRGKDLKVRLRPPFPFVHVTKLADENPNRLFFGKALLYPIVAAPFARLLGLNGLLVFHVLLLAAVAAAGYRFLAAQSSEAAAVTFTSAFLGACVLPVYGVFLMPEIFNFALVFLAYFFWLYKEVAPHSRLNARWTDVAAVVLLGLGTYSKPIPVAVLVAPIVVLAAIRRRFAWALTLGAISVVVAGVMFGLNAAVSGEFNYQGGDRKTFYGAFPFDGSDASWERRGGAVVTDGGTAQQVLTSGDSIVWFIRNVEYFLVGRHFGFIPYFFPGAIAIAAWALSRLRRQAWRLLTFVAFAASAVVMLLVLPFTWSGGGGPPGNRYLFNVYPILFFLMPPMRTAWSGVLAWTGGALFTAKMLANPFVAAKYTWLTTEKGPARRLPVELTMSNDLPVMLSQPLRGHIHYGPYDDSGAILYFLDQNAWPPEPQGMWISGSGRADIIVRTVAAIDHLACEAESPIPTVVTVAAGAQAITVTLHPGKVATFDVPTAGVRGFHDFNYLLTTHSSDAFIPHLMDPSNPDYRNLGAQLRFRLVPAAKD